MRPHLPTVAAVVATVLFVFSSPSFAENRSLAGRHQPHSKLYAMAGVSKSATVAPLFDCETRFFDVSLNTDRNVACYRPSTIRTAYGLSGLISRYSGAGQTIVILDAYGSPTALADLQAFDARFGIRNPSFSVVTMPGTPSFDSENPDHIMWAQEVSLDVQWAHAMAPGANIVLVAAASDTDTDLLAGLNYAINNRLGDVISLSFGESEVFLADAAGQKVVAKWEKAFKRARDRRITVLVSAGDMGSTSTADDFGDVFAFQNVSYPASSPQVTAVGGTNLFFGKDAHADPNGKFIGETVWNDTPQGIAGAGGGGVSALFERPGYQDTLDKSARKSLQNHRGIPDVAYNAGVSGGVIVAMSFFRDIKPGFYVVGGTSSGTAQWSGLIADLNQALARELGFINNRLYRLGANGVRERQEHERGERRDRDGDRDHDQAHLFRDITAGDNGFCGFTPDFDSVCVPGFNATAGWDLATGWGTPNFGVLMSLFDQWDDDHDENN